jgi:hypothetical protein
MDSRDPRWKSDYTPSQHLSALGKYDIQGVPVEKGEQALRRRYREDGQVMASALHALVDKFKRQGNSSLKVADGTEFTLTLTKDLSELHFDMRKGNGMVPYWVASFVPSAEIVEAYKRVYHID